MRDYGKLSPFFWTRGSGKRLRGDAIAQVVAAYLSTSPTANMVGVYYLSIATIANDTGHPADEVRAALGRIEAAGYASYDFDAELVWIPNHATFEIGAQLRPGDKRRPKVYAELNQVSDHRFANDFRKRYATGYGLQPPIELPTKGHPAPKTDTEGASASDRGARAGQDQDQDQDQDRAGGHPPESVPEEAPSGVRPRIVGPDGECGALFAAWTDGIREATGIPQSGLSPSDRRELVAVANTHAGGVKGQALLDWTRATAIAFAKVHDPTFGGFVPLQARKWLDGGRRKRAANGKSIVQSAEGRGWILPEELRDE